MLNRRPKYKALALLRLYPEIEISKKDLLKFFEKNFNLFKEKVLLQ